MLPQSFACHRLGPVLVEPELESSCGCICVDPDAPSLPIRGTCGTRPQPVPLPLALSGEESCGACALRPPFLLTRCRDPSSRAFPSSGQAPRVHAPKPPQMPFSTQLVLRSSALLRPRAAPLAGVTDSFSSSRYCNLPTCLSHSRASSPQINHASSSYRGEHSNFSSGSSLLPGPRLLVLHDALPGPWDSCCALPVIASLGQSGNLAMTARGLRHLKCTKGLSSRTLGFFS